MFMKPRPPRPPGPLPACGAPADGCALESAAGLFSPAAGRSFASDAATSASTFFPVGIAVRMKILSPQMIGVADPEPGIATFHLMFLVSLHSTGGCAVTEVPVHSGPRHCGQD